MNHRAELLERWADALAHMLDRPAADIRAHGLSAGDFSSHNSVDIEWDDGSTASFHHSFFVQDQTLKRTAIFTEHCGYIELETLGIAQIAEKPITN